MLPPHMKRDLFRTGMITEDVRAKPGKLGGMEEESTYQVCVCLLGCRILPRGKGHLTARLTKKPLQSSSVDYGLGDALLAVSPGSVPRCSKGPWNEAYSFYKRSCMTHHYNGAEAQTTIIRVGNRPSSAQNAALNSKERVIRRMGRCWIVSFQEIRQPKIEFPFTVTGMMGTLPGVAARAETSHGHLKAFLTPPSWSGPIRGLEQMKILVADVEFSPRCSLHARRQDNRLQSDCTFQVALSGFKLTADAAWKDSSRPPWALTVDRPPKKPCRDSPVIRVVVQAARCLREKSFAA
ncbi:hypothetical protein QBC40DRAFT_298027 [Triangularia verruculosa]|uniref:Uncharacterized protein n=1 Tax=Triangularia verruculosa TaxID=2587418 RepID=A0AAN7ATK5_9PEZI|nr:hypothetical protein QBC40DRAFT_298027 [Triangularia verruculosa]